MVLLNVGYGLIETVGDGMITFLGLLALSWRPIQRARSALLQGLFLGGLGIYVLAMTAYRVVVQGTPDAEPMGIFGIIAFAVNVGAALILLPHRVGNANMRAVWLFSRNDAIGNLAVVVAAGLVAISGSP